MTDNTAEPPKGTPPTGAELGVVNLRVSTVIADIDQWLSQTKRLFAGPIDITFMALGTVLIAVAIWTHIVGPKIWSAPEFLGFAALAAIAFMVALAERVLVEYGRHQEAELRRIRKELDDLKLIHVELVRSIQPALTEGPRPYRAFLPRLIGGNQRAHDGR